MDMLKIIQDFIDKCLKKKDLEVKYETLKEKVEQFIEFYEDNYLEDDY